MTGDDYRTAWVTASRDDERARWHALYDAVIPPPPPPPPPPPADGQADCTHLHSAFGPGCPYCTPARRAS